MKDLYATETQKEKKMNVTKVFKQMSARSNASNSFCSELSLQLDKMVDLYKTLVSFLEISSFIIDR